MENSWTNNNSMHADCSRKNIRKLSVESEYSAEQLQALQSVTSLDLSHNQLCSLGQNALARPFCNVVSLTVSYNNLSTLDGLPQTLKKLFASHNAIVNLAPLIDLNALEVVDLCNNRLVSLKGLPGSVTTLLVDDNEIRTLKGLERCPNLTMLQAERNKIESLDAVTAIVGPSSSGVEVMSLMGNPICDTIPRYRKIMDSLFPHVGVFDRTPRNAIPPPDVSEIQAALSPKKPRQVMTVLPEAAAAPPSLSTLDHISMLSNEVSENEALRKQNKHLLKENKQLKELCRRQLDRIRGLKADVERLRSSEDGLRYKSDKHRRDYSYAHEQLTLERRAHDDEMSRLEMLLEEQTSRVMHLEHTTNTSQPSSSRSSSSARFL
eukprot:PhM_4_TR11114/c0_g1_i1/m.91331/K17550/PPP1R7, SDS22; protein phosphatase 1 regulatory subunit 7